MMTPFSTLALFCDATMYIYDSSALATHSCRMWDWH